MVRRPSFLPQEPPSSAADILERLFAQEREQAVVQMNLSAKNYALAAEPSCEPELKVEVTVYTENVDKTIEAVKKVHPYEEPVINVIPLWRTSF